MITSKERLSDIDNIDDLQTRIKQVKLRIKESEVELQERVKRVPVEVLKATAGSIVPLVLGNGVASGAFNLGKNILGKIFGKKEKDEDGKPKGWLGTIASPVKKIGLFSALKLAYGLIKK